MLVWLTDFSHIFGLLNLFRYLTFRTLGAAATGLFLVFFFGPTIICRAAPETGQGPADPRRWTGLAPPHQEGHADDGRADDPVWPVRLVAAVGQLVSPYVWTVLFVTVGFGGIGFYDDYLKVTKQSHQRFFRTCAARRRVRHCGDRLLRDDAFRNAGNDLARGAFCQRLPLRHGLGVPAVRPVRHRRFRQCGQSDRRARRPGDRAGDDRGGDLGLIAYFAGNLLYSQYLLINHVPYAGELIVICGALVGAGSGSSGSTRRRPRFSWATPGRWRSAACWGPWRSRSSTRSCSPSIGGLFVMEALSVVVQVASFKLTGKRVFRMAPIHHHFEQLGWSEPQIVMRFWIIAIVLAMVGLATLKLR